MKTLGVDLASQPVRTAACEVVWDGETATASEPLLNLDDDALLGLIASADKVGIDAPFGWPEAFVEAVVSHRDGQAWPSTTVPDLRYRLTDRMVTEVARRPLSVSSDLIAVAAMRCAGLLHALADRGEPVDRSGGGKVVEVYPAAALVVWGFDPRGYKRAIGREKREQLIDHIQRVTSEWLQLTPAVVERCSVSDDCLDALVAALVARAAAVGATVGPTKEQLPLALREGWIHLPAPGSLDTLSGRGDRDLRHWEWLKSLWP